MSVFIEPPEYTADVDRLAALLHGTECTCPHSVDGPDVELAERLIANGAGRLVLDAIDERDRLREGFRIMQENWPKTVAALDYES